METTTLVISDTRPRNGGARLWLGVGALVLGSYLIGDAGQRWRLLWSIVEHRWPWAVLGLAAFSFFRLWVRVESLVVPGVLALIALFGLGLGGRAQWGHLIRDTIGPAALIVGGVAMLLSLRLPSRPDQHRWIGVLVSGGRKAPEQVTGILRARVFFGEMHLDLTTIEQADEGIVLFVTVVSGVLFLRVPLDREIKLHGEGALLTGFVEPATAKSSDPNPIELHLLSFCGLVVLRR